MLPIIRQRVARAMRLAFKLSEAEYHLHYLDGTPRLSHLLVSLRRRFGPANYPVLL